MARNTRKTRNKARPPGSDPLFDCPDIPRCVYIPYMTKTKNSPTPQRTRPHLSQGKCKTFLECLQRVGMNVSKACREAGVGKSTVYLERQRNPDFAAQWQEVEDSLLDELEEHQFRDARVNPEDRRWVLSRRRKARWSERQQVQAAGAGEGLLAGGQVDVKELSDAQLQAIVKEHLGTIPDGDYTVETPDDAGTATPTQEADDAGTADAAGTDE